MTGIGILHLNDEELIVAYTKALSLKLSEDFIQLLKDELGRRNLEV
ncbi:sporulation histidine kinase inhibitor Sda [Radiobacillus sp. PE A8.2]